MSEKKIVEFKGIVVANPCNLENYKVYGLAVDYYQYPEIKNNKYNNVSITGNLPNLDDGIEYMVKAEEQENKHGTSYKVINIKRDRPKTEASTRLFLQEILTSYDQVDEIMREYPDIIDRVINNRLDDIDLKKLYNIGEYRFNIIKRKIIENFALAELVDEFKGYIEFKVLKILYDKYGSVDKIKEELKDDPYKCLCRLSRIGFKTADKILLEFSKECQKLKDNGEKPPIDFGYDLQTSSQRQKSAIMFLLEENENEGNTRLSIKELRKQSESLAKKCIEHFVGIIKNDTDIFFDKETMTVALYETYDTEKYISERIIDGLKVENKWDIDTIKYKSNSDITLTDQQYQILPMLCEKNICILNGFGGSGKSATTKSIIDMLKDNHKSFVLFAPTGRASKVLAEYTQEQASTIHRGLGYMPPSDWGYNSDYPLKCDVVIVDEFSMVDIFLAKHLLEAINFNKTKLLMIGDSAQIPSVSAGNVFHDLIKSNKIPIVSLTQIFRYGEGGILTVATKTRNCESFLSNSTQPQIYGNDKGYMFIPMKQEKIINNVVALYKKLLSTGISKEDILILSSYNVGDYGTVNINKHLQPVSNPNVELNGINIQIGETKFYEDDLVIQTANNYKAIRYNERWIDEDNRTFIANGEIGKIVKIEYGKVIIQFDELVIYDKSEMLQVKLAYSISTHKSQGGQAKIVILITPKAHTFMLNSNLIYVGQTRAKEKVFHFGEIETVNRAIKKKADFNRETYLKELLLE
jgi:exodeoxyribonuclease V alpha subunit